MAFQPLQEACAEASTASAPSSASAEPVKAASLITEPLSKLRPVRISNMEQRDDIGGLPGAAVERFGPGKAERNALDAMVGRRPCDMP